jgi:hypothetical protein
MYASNTFNKKERTDWKNKPKILKNNFDQAKLYFEGLVRDYKTYEQNSVSTMSKSKYDSANQVKEADKGNKLHDYIAQITIAAVAREEQQVELTANLCNSDNTKMKEINTMASQIKSLTNDVALLTLWLANKENKLINKSVNKSTGGGCQAQQYTKP